ncbi:radical SAM protein [Bradyrhizobium sp. AUGA SZCCT0274]|uniref:radical SAM protein n=1 Tax=Bradyrhizobium sp. AUGA SZCCT0274 TaxID=2807670 RepID=UPI001BA9FC93|nr:radical SAM protein [Bradyrhizobium sp. AUGA SZCCT0274]MBR1240307.1 radical SAM protein [Bradyrhizobium sp. AUGA SZCCT0274]
MEVKDKPLANGLLHLDRVTKLEWVVKISKLCNLRCSYCYEFNSLANRQHMTLGQIESFLQNVAGLAEIGIKRHDFVWHGGEPTLRPTSYFEDIFALQRKILGKSKVEFSNHIQTNLYRLTPQWLSLLASGAFQNIGVSFDFSGDMRVSRSGSNSNLEVVRNMDRLTDAGIVFSAITVLHRDNIKHVDEIFDFFASIDCPFRCLPIYRDAEGRSNDPRACSTSEIRAALLRVSCRWYGSSQSIAVQPLSRCLESVQRYMATGKLSRYEKRRDHCVFVVDTNGALYGNADGYSPELSYLNVFGDDLRQLEDSQSWQDSVSASEARLRGICHECEFYGVCDGYDVAEATERELVSGGSGADRCSTARTIYRDVYLREGLRLPETLMVEV